MLCLLGVDDQINQAAAQGADDRKQMLEKMTMSRTLATGRSSRMLRAKVGLVVLATASVGVLAACGSDDTSKGSTAKGDGGANVSEAKRIVEAASAPLTSANLPELKSAPPKGKKIAFVTNNLPASLDILGGAKKAGEALGWDVVGVVYDPTKPTGLQDAFLQAADENPDGVVALAADRNAYAQAAKEFEAKKIPVVTSSTGDAVDSMIIANVLDLKQIEQSGRLTAAYVIATKGDKASAAMFTVPSFSILSAYEKGFKEEFSRLCSGCAYKSVSVQPGDIGTKIPSQVVSTLQTDPKINTLVMGFGNVSAGVPAALKAAGISGVSIVGEAPNESNTAALRDGTEEMWVAFPIEGTGWQSIDPFARLWAGESVEPSTTSDEPFQILTKDNAPESGAPEIVDQEAYFKKLWKLG